MSNQHLVVLEDAARVLQAALEKQGVDIELLLADSKKLIWNSDIHVNSLLKPEVENKIAALLTTI